MTFIETPIFTDRVQQLLPDDSYRELQLALVLRPNAGKLIPGSGGLRKIRWRIHGRGKRGGLRIIYYWDTPDDSIFMLYIFTKNRQEDLRPSQLKVLRKLVQEWLQ